MPKRLPARRHATCLSVRVLHSPNGPCETFAECCHFHLTCLVDQQTSFLAEQRPLGLRDCHRIVKEPQTAMEGRPGRWPGADAAPTRCPGPHPAGERFGRSLPDCAPARRCPSGRRASGTAFPRRAWERENVCTSANPRGKPAGKSRCFDLLGDGADAAVMIKPGHG